MDPGLRGVSPQPCRGSDVVQLYLSDPAAAGEPPRQLVDFARVTLAPGRSTQVRLAVSPRARSWWDQPGGGWNQSTGTYRLYLGDSSALSGLPLRARFRVTATAGSRHVVIAAPRTAVPGKSFLARVRLTASGNQTLHDVRLLVRAPQGWHADPVGQASFGTLRPATAATATFRVTPPAWAVPTDVTLQGVARLGPAVTREAGTSVTVAP